MKFRQFLGIVEMRTKVVSVGTFTVAALYASWSGAPIAPLLAAVTFAAALMVDMGTTGFNTYFDWYRNVDDARFNRETDKVLVHEGVEPGAALLASLACFAAAAVLGLALAMMTSAWLIPVGALCMLVGFLYSAGPRPISATPFGELFAGGFLGGAFFLIVVYILSGGFGPGALGAAMLACIPQSLSVASILAANNACDIVGDTAAGRRTLAILLGARKGPWAVYLSGGAAILAMAALGGLGILPVWDIATATVAAIIMAVEYGRMHRRGFGHGTKGSSMQAVSRTFLLQAAAFAGGIIIDFVVHH
jgi:1,4-dihydroxy-2-naphthoate octaprenyltransferase